MRWLLRIAVLVCCCAGIFPEGVFAQRKKGADDGMILPPVLNNTKKEKAENKQSAPKEVIASVTASGDAQRLSFSVSALETHGKLSEQARDALRSLIRASQSARVLKIRAFVAGSGDLRRIAELAGEAFREKHLPVPVVTTVRVGALPVDTAQVQLEAVSEGKQVTNPKGVVFVSGTDADTLEKSVGSFSRALKLLGGSSDDVLALTCFVDSLAGQEEAKSQLASFKEAAISLIQMRRESERPRTICEGVARITSAATASNAHAASGEVTFLAPQFVYGSNEKALDTAFDHLLHGHGGQALSATVYEVSLRDKQPAASQDKFLSVTVEAVPSIEASAMIDAVAATR